MAASPDKLFSLEFDGLVPSELLSQLRTTDGRSVRTVGDWRRFVLERFAEKTSHLPSWDPLSRKVAREIFRRDSPRRYVFAYWLLINGPGLIGTTFILSAVIFSLYVFDVFGASATSYFAVPVFVLGATYGGWAYSYVREYFVLQNRQVILTKVALILCVALAALAKPIRDYRLSVPSIPTMGTRPFAIRTLLTNITLLEGNGTYNIPLERLMFVRDENSHKFPPSLENLLPLVEHAKRAECEERGKDFSLRSLVAVTAYSIETDPKYDVALFRFVVSKSDSLRYWAIHDAIQLRLRESQLEPFVSLVESLNGTPLPNALANPSTSIGIFALVRTADDLLVVSRRGDRTHVKDGVWTSSVNRALDFEKDILQTEGTTIHPLHSAISRGLERELGMSPDRLGQLQLLGIGYDQFHHFGFVVLVRTDLIFKELLALAPPREPRESMAIEDLSLQPREAVQKMLSLGIWDEGAFVDVVLALIHENGRRGKEVIEELRRHGIEKIRLAS